MILFFSKKILQIPGLEKFLEATTAPYGRLLENDARAVAGWGNKATTAEARACAKRLGIPFLALEDGFVRSIGVGDDDPPLSMVIDHQGIYYDGRAPSELERLIGVELDGAESARAISLQQLWRSSRVSKYNYSSDCQGTLDAPYVLVVDQTFGDASIEYGLASASSFSRMLDCALAENPDVRIILKVHPEVMLGRKQGHFDVTALMDHPRVTVLGDDIHAAGLIAVAEAVLRGHLADGLRGVALGKARTHLRNALLRRLGTHG